MTANTAKTARAAANVFACRCSLVETASGETTGCASLTNRAFAPGHDAKLKSLLGLALANDELVTVTTPATDDDPEATATTEEVSPLEAAGRFGNFGYLVVAIAEKVRAKRDRAEAHRAKLAANKARREAERTNKKPRKASAVVLPVQTAKVGRWTYEGVVKGDRFVYANKKGETVEAERFQLVTQS